MYSVFNMCAVKDGCFREKVEGPENSRMEGVCCILRLEYM